MKRILFLFLAFVGCGVDNKTAHTAGPKADKVVTAVMYIWVGEVVFLDVVVGKICEDGDIGA